MKLGGTDLPGWMGKAMHGRDPLLSIFILFLASWARVAAQSVPAPGSAPETLAYLTEESPPDNYHDGKILTGLFVETLALVWDELGISHPPIEVQPWARAYQRLLDTPGTVLFSIGRTPERDKLFKWVGPLRSTRFVLIARKDRGFAERPPEPSGFAGFRIGTVRQDAAEQLLVAEGWSVDGFDRSTDPRSLFRKLESGRIDLAAYGELPARTWMRANGIDPVHYTTISLISQTPLYYGFHLSTPQSLVDRFQAALDRVKQRPQFKALLEKYDASPSAP